MPILSKQPYVDADGAEYPFLAVHSFIARADVREKSIGAPVNLNLQPFRVLPDGTIVLAPQSAMRTVLMADAYKSAELDPDVAGALQAIFGGIEAFIDGKGL